MLVAGVDEVGRGPLAGPVVACAVILGSKHDLEGLNDSKKLTEKKRLLLCELIKEKAISWSVAMASVKEIEEINILNASLLAMQRAVHKLKIQPQKVLVDGNKVPKLQVPVRAIIGGDATVPEISAASIVAKVIRDYMMCLLDKTYPEYGFKKHKGYGTKLHMEALNEHGISPIHRKNFAPVQRLISNTEIYS